MSCGIYKITNKINGHSYIGQSINITERWSNEKLDSCNKNSINYNSSLSKAFRKYGIYNFSFEIIEECSIEELNNKEQYYIHYFNTYNDGYNETTGGSGSMNYEFKLTKEDLEQIYDLLINSQMYQKDIAKKFNVGEDVISTINNGKSRRQIGYTYPLRNNILPKNKCIDCGKEIDRNATRCVKCDRFLHRKVNRPTREELKYLIRNISFTQIGKQFGVSDNSIRKWCVDYNLPSSKREINNFSDEEWLKI